MVSTPFEKVQSLLRLACKRGNGFPGERQGALNKAIEQSAKHGLDLPRVIFELEIDLSELLHDIPIVTERPSREASGSVAPPPHPPISATYPIAGFQYYDGPRIRQRVSIGDGVRLIALTTNPYDLHAVAVYWQTFHIGFLPRAENEPVWVRLRDGRALAATVVFIGEYNGYGAIRIHVQG